MGTRWDPFRDLVTLQEHLNRLFEGAASGHEHPGGLSGWHPPSDVCEFEREIHVYVEVPGVEPDSFELVIEDNRLTLSGERTRPGSGKGAYHQTEILMGPFHRTFILPANVDPEGIEARYRQGILTIILPKMETPLQQKTSINIKQG